MVESIEAACKLLAEYNRLGHFGARGMSEIPYLAYATAIIRAMFDATGVWLDEILLTPYKLLAGLRNAGFR